MELTTLHHAVRNTIRGEAAVALDSGIEGVAFKAWRNRLDDARDLAIASAKEWIMAPSPVARQST